MWPFETSASRALKKAQERDNCIRVLKDCAAKGDASNFGTPVITLLDRHLDDTRLPGILAGLVDDMAKENLRGATEMALYLASPRRFETEQDSARFKEIQMAVSEKALVLMPRMIGDGTSCAFGVAGVTMLSAVVALAAEPGSDMERRAISQWESAFDILAAKSIDNYALAAACNAVCGFGGSRALADVATTKFEQAVAELALKDRPAAAAVAQQFEQKCREFEAPHKQRAAQLVQRVM